MTLADLDPAQRHREVASRFGDLVSTVTRWDAPTPVENWQAQDVVEHLLDWFPAFLASGGVQLPDPPGEADLIRQWQHQSTAIQALLDDPDKANSEFGHPMAGMHRLAGAVDRFYTADVFMHTWDLARAAGLNAELDESWAEQMLAGMEPIDELLRSSGQYGPRVDVDDSASPSARLMAFVGRDPTWTADRQT